MEGIDRSLKHKVLYYHIRTWDEPSKTLTPPSVEVTYQILSHAFVGRQNPRVV